MMYACYAYYALYAVFKESFAHGRLVFPLLKMLISNDDDDDDDDDDDEHINDDDCEWRSKQSWSKF